MDASCASQDRVSGTTRTDALRPVAPAVRRHRRCTSDVSSVGSSTLTRRPTFPLCLPLVHARPLQWWWPTTCPVQECSSSSVDRHRQRAKERRTASLPLDGVAQSRRRQLQPTPPHCTRPRSGTRGMEWRAVVECACTDAICPLLLLLRPCCRHRRPCRLCSARLCCCRCVWVTSSWSERSLS